MRTDSARRERTAADDERVLAGLLRQPTAPFREEAVAAWIERYAAERGWSCVRDGAGNRWVEGPAPRGGRARGSHWIYVAHMDHPGFVAVAQRGRRLTAQFRGHVTDACLVRGTARFFAPSGDAVARVRSAGPDPESPFRRCALELPAGARVPPGTIGMWDVPAVRLRGRAVFARACDDLAGCAAALCAMERMARGRPAHRATLLFTRGEETGFVGALWAARRGAIPRGARLLSIETSKAQPLAPLGGGAVIRVGDRVSVFDPGLTAQVEGVAAALAAADPSRRYVRQLMPGGVCEATAFQAAGFRCAAVCIPLGAYHNMGEGGRIAPERIRRDDFRSLVELLAALPAAGAPPDRVPAATVRRLAALLRERGRYLREPRG